MSIVACSSGLTGAVVEHAEEGVPRAQGRSESPGGPPSGSSSRPLRWPGERSGERTPRFFLGPRSSSSSMSSSALTA
eukprot:14865210-Heterocapsa_arctica.AAC.1